MKVFARGGFALLTLMVCAAAWSGPVADTFGDGVFGVPWGATTQEVELAKPGGRWDKVKGTKVQTYTVQDGRTILGVERDAKNQFVFVFNFSGMLNDVEIEFPAKNAAALAGSAVQAFGPYEVTSLQNYVISKWPEDAGIQLKILNKVGILSASELNLSISRPTATGPASKESMGFQ